MIDLYINDLVHSIVDGSWVLDKPSFLLCNKMVFISRCNAFELFLTTYPFALIKTAVQQSSLYTYQAQKVIVKFISGFPI